jgi:pimeloyl-ACP methyl ester carboxylesterase
MSSDKRTSAPNWFRHAIKTPFEDRYVVVRGCCIHYLRWGKPRRPGLLFIHGGYAHAHWWSFLAPAFAEHYCVAAIDLGGMGDSQHRKKYTPETFTEEVMAVCDDAGLADKPIVVGHSFGGLVALKTGVLHGDKLTGVVLVDFPLRPPEAQKEYDSRRPVVRTKEIYPDRQAAFKRFRLIPSQPCENQFILDYIAGHSLGKVNGGWSWKFDEKMFEHFKSGDVAGDLTKVKCRLAVIYGERSALFPKETVDYMSTILAKNQPVVVMPHVHHHLFLEQPLAFIQTLMELLTSWHSAKHSRVTAHNHKAKCATL